MHFKLSDRLKKEKLLPLFESGLLNWIPDKAYLKLEYGVITGKRLHLNPPETFNEKIQWIKLNERKPLFQVLADKLCARDFISTVIGDTYLISLIGVWERAEDIDFGALPERFVLKCTHGYGNSIVCHEKSRLDIEATVKFLGNSLNTDYFSRGREWAYKHAQPKIIAEVLVDDGGGSRPADYKCMCFGGKVELICVSRNLADHTKGCLTFFYPDGTRAPFKRKDYIEIPSDEELPPDYHQIIDAAERLAAQVQSSFLRVDFYRTSKGIFFSEFTFYPCGGTMFLEPPCYDRLLGKMLNIKA